MAERYDFAVDQKWGKCHGSPNMSHFMGEEHEVGASYKGVYYLRLESTMKELVVVQISNKLLIVSCYQTSSKYNNV